jgi:ribosomal protein S18 acetylase RimI-like enzyme
MEIVKGEPGHIAEVMALVFEVIADMRTEGQDQWDEHYPTRELFEGDLAAGTLHEAREGGELVGVVVLDREQSEGYSTVAWTTLGEGVFVVHRLAVSPRWQGRGVGRRLMDFAEEEARKLGGKAIRLDAYTANPAVLALYERRGYRMAGIVRYPRRKFDFNCYEREL